MEIRALNFNQLTIVIIVIQQELVFLFVTKINMIQDLEYAKIALPQLLLSVHPVMGQLLAIVSVALMI
jgi:hypothetical protein